jgi:hypothetical protein
MKCRAIWRVPLAMPFAALALSLAATSCRSCENARDAPPKAERDRLSSAPAAPDTRVVKSIISRARTPEGIKSEATKLAFPDVLAAQDEDVAARNTTEVEIAFSDGEEAQMRFGPDFVDHVVDQWNGLPNHFFLADMHARTDKGTKVKEADVIVELHVAVVALNKDRLELVGKGMLADPSRLSIPWQSVEYSKLAGRPCELKFDFGRYQIRNDERAIGVRVRYPEAERYKEETYLYLFRWNRAAGTLTPIFDVKLVATCNDCTASEHNVVIMSKKKTGGSFDIIVRNRESGAKMTYRWDGSRYRPPASAVTWDRSLGIKRQQDIHAELARVLPADEHAKLVKEGAPNRIARNCPELSQLRGQGYAAVSKFDLPNYHALCNRCAVLQALKKTRTAKVDYLAGFRLGQEALRYLPPNLTAVFHGEDSARAAEASKAGKSWMDFEPGATATGGPDSLVVRNEGTEVALRIWARGDFNGDGVQDLLVETDGETASGYYRTDRMYVLTRRSLGARLDVVAELE